MINKKTGFERKDNPMKSFVGKKEIDEIKKELEWEGDARNHDSRLTRLINTVELLGRELEKAHNGKAVLLTERDKSRKATVMAIESLLDLKHMFTNGSHVSNIEGQITMDIGKIEKLVGFEGLPLQLLERLANIK